ncbi:Galactose oxidase central domain protein [Theileria parva strain Muguga]|uniref:Galactose oxidase central domain protein n=1 Tax=Theileria parva strain Muguga TaxID=333668 RepID=UPI001C61F914|nr:Galactose oxidase central domain protein [Theileria parva strain Muguga]EAN31880.2 Galactose oxidase central domain protein [Theileria parva strain Muguga]
MNLNSGVFGHTISPFVIYKYGFNEDSNSSEQNCEHSSSSDDKTEEKDILNEDSSNINESNPSNNENNTSYNENNNSVDNINSEDSISLDKVSLGDYESSPENAEKSLSSSDFGPEPDNPNLSSSTTSNDTNTNAEEEENEPKIDLSYYKEYARKMNMMRKDDVAYTRFLNEVNMNEVKSLLYGTWRPEDSEKMWLEITGPERDTNIIFHDNQVITEEELIQSKDEPWVILSCDHMYEFVMYDVDNRNLNDKFKYNTKYVLLFGGASIKENGFSQYYVNMYAFLHGLKNVVVSDDLYYLDAQSFTGNWELLKTNNTPEPRAFHASCVMYVALDTPILLVCGGFTHNKLLLDTHLHVLNLTTEPLTWTIFQTSGPSPPKRFGHSMAQVGNYVVIFGGCNGSFLLNDLWALNVNCGTFLVPGKISSNSWMEIPFRGLTPSPRAFHSTCKTGISSTAPMIIFGGLTKQISPRTRLYALHSVLDDYLTWSILPVYVRCPYEFRTFHSMAFVSNSIVITGGDDFKHDNVRNIKSVCYTLETKAFRYIEDVVNLSGHQSWSAYGMLYHFGGIRNEGGKFSYEDSISISNPLTYCDDSNVDEVYLKYIQYASMVLNGANINVDSSKVPKTSATTDIKAQGSEQIQSSDSIEGKDDVNVVEGELGPTSTNEKCDKETPVGQSPDGDKQVTEYNMETGKTVKDEPVANTQSLHPTGAVVHSRPRRSAAIKCLSAIEEDHLRHKEREKEKSEKE